jgi:hypothetical protein
MSLNLRARMDRVERLIEALPAEVEAEDDVPDEAWDRFFAGEQVPELEDLEPYRAALERMCARELEESQS